MEKKRVSRKKSQEKIDYLLTEITNNLSVESVTRMRLLTDVGNYF